MFKSLFHWKVLVNILLAIAVFAGLIWLTFRWLEYHTHHGEEIPVPNVMNMTVHDAIKVLDDSGLEYEVDSAQFNPVYKPFQVLMISPSPGSRVKGGRSILLKVNPRTWAKVAVPDIIDRYKGLAFNQLNLVGLKVGDTLYEPSIQRDAVLRILYNNHPIKPGELLPKFSTVDLVIGAGPKRNVAVPNVVGRTVQEAKQIIAQYLFEVGIVDYESGAVDESAIVYYQDPAGGSLRDQGMQIDLWASKKTPAEMFNKIKDLDMMYRPRIDTVAPTPLRFEEVEIDRPEPVAVKPKPAPEKKANDAPKPTVTATPSSTTTNASGTNKPANTEKPKEKKKVIVE